MGYTVTDKYEVDGSTSWVIRDGQILGCIIFRDIARDDASAMITKMKEMGDQR